MLGRHAAGFFTDGAFAEIRFERATAPLANVAWLDLGADAALPVTRARSRVIPSFVEVSGVRDHRAVDRGGAWRWSRRSSRYREFAATAPLTAAAHGEWSRRSSRYREFAATAPLTTVAHGEWSRRSSRHRNPRPPRHYPRQRIASAFPVRQGIREDALKASSMPILKDLVLVGGGHSHVIVLKRFGMKPMPGVRVTLISRDVETPYSGMLPGHVAGHYTHDDIHIDLGPLTRFAHARFYHDEVIGLDPVERKVICRTRPPVPYDVLSIDIGSAPRMHDVPGAEGAVVPVKRSATSSPAGTRSSSACSPPGARYGSACGARERAASRWCSRCGTGCAPGSARQGQSRSAELRLFTAGPMCCPATRPGSAPRSPACSPNAVCGFTSTRGLDRVTLGVLHAAGGAVHEFDEVLWVTQAGAQAWLAEAGARTDESGFAAVRPTLESTSHPGVFAAGTAPRCSITPERRPGSSRSGKVRCLRTICAARSTVLH